MCIKQIPKSKINYTYCYDKLTAAFSSRGVQSTISKKPLPSRLCGCKNSWTTPQARTCHRRSARMHGAVEGKLDQQIRWIAAVYVHPTTIIRTVASVECDSMESSIIVVFAVFVQLYRERALQFHLLLLALEDEPDTSHTRHTKSQKLGRFASCKIPLATKTLG